MKLLNIGNAGLGARGSVLASRHIYFDAPHLLTSGNVFTITNVTVTPVITSVGGRPCVSMAGGGAGTDGSNFWIGTAGILLGAGKALEWWLTFNSANFAAHELMCGLSTVGTGVTAAVNGGTEPLNFCLVGKDNTETTLSVHARKASGTSQKFPTTFPTGQNDTWYRLHVRAERDPSVAGKARLAVYCGPDALDPTERVWSQPINGEFPDTVATALGFGWLAGDTNTDAMRFGEVGWALFK